jgi:hypothetical protein
LNKKFLRVLNRHDYFLSGWEGGPASRESYPLGVTRRDGQSLARAASMCAYLCGECDARMATLSQAHEW